MQKIINKIKNKLPKKTISKNNFGVVKGIVMVEALMSIAIMMISVMAPITLSTQSAKYAKYTLNKITASYLAEEQIEMMVNFKKSLDIYCFDNTCVGQNSFDEFVKNVTLDEGLNCESYKLDGSENTPCYFDETSFTYNGTNKPSIVDKTQLNCKVLYENPDDIMSCSNNTSSTGNVSIFSRKMYIDSIDSIESSDKNQVYENAVKLTSWVCINNKDCSPSDAKATTLIYFIYK
jgi:hypothetical protein